MIKDTPSRKKQIWSWAFYDWANSAFATTVMAGFFPLFFKQYWSPDHSAAESSFSLGLVNSLSSVLLVVLAPFLGHIADQLHNKKLGLLSFTVLGSLATLLLYFPEPGQTGLVLTLFFLGCVGFNAANIFYDSLLIDVTKGDRMDTVSGFGYSMGYIGGALLFSVNVFMFLKPQIFGLADGAAAIKVSFVMVGIWWFLFSLPLMKWVHEIVAPTRIPLLTAVKQSHIGLISTFRSLAKNRKVLLFLLAYLFYIDAVNTIIKMAVDFGLSIGFQASDLITALLLTNFIGFPAAILYSWFWEKRRAETGILVAIAVYLGICVLGFFMEESWHFYALAALVGLVQGGIQALSRSVFARLVPPSQSTEFFGFFNIMGKFSAIFGPLLMGLLSLWTGNPKSSLLVVAVFLFVGAGLFVRHQRINP